jgi:hypothetical protein
MGVSTSWIAVKGKTPEKVLAELGLKLAGFEEKARSSGVQGATFPGGWYVIALRGYEHSLTRPAVIKNLSVGCEVITGGAESHVMCSTASGWIDSKKVWSVTHECDDGVENLVTEGNLPRGFEGIRDEALSEQAKEGYDSNVDYAFGVSSDLCVLLTGYDYDYATPDEQWHAIRHQSWIERLLNR